MAENPVDRMTKIGNAILQRIEDTLDDDTVSKSYDGNYGQTGGGDYTQTGGGTHSQSGGGSYNQGPGTVAPKSGNS